MAQRCKLLATCAALALASVGCYRSTYINKANEAENLSRELSQVQQKNVDLAAENNTQKVRIANLITVAAKAEKERDKLSASLATTTQQQARMAEKSRATENALRANVDSQSKTIEDMGRRMGDLQIEKSRLQKELESLQKSHQEKIRNVTSTYETWLAKTKEEIAEGMKEEIRRGQVNVKESREGLTVNLVGSILFDPGETNLNADGAAILQKAIPVLKNVKDRVIRVEGHTDNLPIHHATAIKYPTNLELSVARAITVVKYLEEQGVDPGNLIVVGYGDVRPVADNRTPEGRALNRRIEIVLVP